jgi:hypothetical protein
MKWPPTNGPLTDEISQIMLGDHFSPVVGSIVPDFLGSKSIRRAQELEDSFIASVKSAEGAPASGPAVDTAVAKLTAPYLAHWTDDQAEPALVLNATWADTGYRVAFAPFTLKNSGKGILYSFADAEMPGEDITLIHAALVSARFPGILPPYSVLMPDTTHRWSFVDGGYSDSSGAQSALDIYDSIDPEKHPEYKSQGIELRLVLLTSANPQPRFAKINGTPFRDTVAPINAVMNVREGLGNQAVARACNALDVLETCKNQTNDKLRKLEVIQLQEQAFALPLGWKISKTTFGLVSLLIGRPERCGSDNVSDTKPNDGSNTPDDEAKRVFMQIWTSNSCVLRSIENALKEP